ncbi:biotin/lipoyl-containing protein, partial [Cryobacterium tagatosivorans]
MSESVILPALGESVTEGTVTRWLKNVGDRVEVDEPLLEVSTDKVDTEIPSPIAGVIEAILVQEDETVEVGTPLVTIGDGSGAAEAPAAEAPAAEAPAAEAPAAEAPAAEAPAAAAAPVAEVPSAEAPAPAEEAAPVVAPPAP